MNAKKGTNGPVDYKEDAKKVDIIFEVLEVGNMALAENRFYMDATFMGKSLTRPDGFGIFEACICGPVDTVNFKWKLPVKIKNEDDIINLSNNPILVRWMKLLTEYESDIPNPLKVEHLNEQGHAIVDLSAIVTKSTENIIKIVNFQSIRRKYGANIETWPNAPFIKYKLTSSAPILQEDKPYKTVSITLESVFNLPENLLGKEFTYEIGYFLPFKAQVAKTVICKNGKFIQPGQLSSRKVFCTMSHFEHAAKFTEVATNLSYSRDDIEYPKEESGCKMQLDLPTINQNLISFYGLYKFTVLEDTFKSLLKSKHLAIEISVKDGAITERFVSFLNLVHFSHVGINRIRKLVPFIKFNLRKIKDLSGHQKEIFPTGKKLVQKQLPPPKENPKKGTQALKPTSIEPEHSPFIKNNEGYTTCVAIEFEVDSPLIPRQENSLTMKKIDQIRTAKVHKEPPYTEEELNFLFRREIGTFIRLIESKEQNINLDTLSSVEQMCIATNEGDMFGTAAALLSKRFNFSKAVDDESSKNMLENSYIYIINKIYEVLDPEDSTENTLTDIEFRNICALECFELEMLEDAKDFYIMSIRDTQNLGHQYVSLAMHCLLIGDMQMCLECCADALKRDSSCNICYLLQSYVAFVYNDMNRAEEILKRLILSCDNFIEAWMALLLIHFQAEKKAEIKFDQQNIYLAQQFAYITPFHNKKEILWEPGEYNDPRLNAVIKFIQWGCLEYAELGLSVVINDYGCTSYEYLYHMALIDYYRKYYSSALQRLGDIKTKPGTNLQCDNIIKLRIQCLLNMESLKAVTYMRELLKMSAKDKLNDQFNVMCLKMGKIYIGIKKYKTAIFYLKQCCNKFGGFAGYALLGTAALKCNFLKIAEHCFKMAYKINPFNGISWGYLAIIYFRKNLVPQYRLCKTNARKQKRLDNKLSQELERIEADWDQRRKTKVCEEMKLRGRAINTHSRKINYDMISNK